MNDYEEMVNGKATKFQDIFSEFTDRSFRLVEAISTDTGSMKPLITTKYARMPQATQTSKLTSGGSDGSQTMASIIPAQFKLARTSRS